MKKIINSEYLYHLLIFIFFLIATLILASYIGFNRHWSSVFDHELTLAYNALLYNNGIQHEYLAHPAYFTILFLSFFLKILNILNIIEVYKLSLITLNNFDQSLQEIIFYTRLYSSICVSIFCSLIYFSFWRFTGNKSYSFLLSLLALTSIGTIFHITQLRSELMSMFFFTLSFLSLKIFLENEKKNKIIYLIGFFLFLYCSLLSKMQIFFYIPLLFVIFYFTKVNIKSFDFREFTFLNRKIIPYLFSFIVLFYIYLVNKSLHPFPIFSAVVVILNILIINIIFYLILKKNNIETYNNLITFNLLLISVFFILKTFLSIHPSTAPEMFSNLTRIINLRMYISSDLSLIVESNSEFTYVIIKTFFINFSTLLKEFLLTVNLYGLLIIINVTLCILYRKRFNKELILFNLSCVFVSIAILTISSFRNNGFFVDHYLIYSDFFLILSFCSFSKFLKLRYLSLLVIFISLINFNDNLDLIKKQKNIFENKSKLCNNTYFYDWHKKIEKNYLLKFCKNPPLY